MGWVVVHLAPDLPGAETVRDLLRREGLMVAVRPAGGLKAAGEAGFEVLVPSSEARDASEVLTGSWSARRGNGRRSRRR